MRFAIPSCACALVFTTGCALGPQSGKTHIEAPFGASQPTAEVHEHAPCIFSMLLRQSAPDVTKVSQCPADPPGLSPARQAVLGQVADEAIDSIVRITTVRHRREARKRNRRGTRATSTRSGGSGVVISAEGLILTSAHVVSGAEVITVLFHNGVEYAVESVAIDATLDLALLRIGGADLEALLPSTSVLYPDTPVVAVAGTKANSSSLATRLRFGIVAATGCSLQQELGPSYGWDYSHLVESTMKLDPGFSGGPLLDSAGHLVGLNVAATDASANDRHRAYAIPFNERTREAVNRLILTVDARLPGNANTLFTKVSTPLLSEPRP